MRSIAEQVKAFMAYRSTEGHGEYTEAQMAKDVASFQGILEEKRRCKRQDIEHLLRKNIQKPRYLVELAKAMGTTAEVLIDGTYDPAAPAHGHGSGSAAPVVLQTPAARSPQEELVRALDLVAEALGNANEKVQNTFVSMLSLLANEPRRSGITAQRIAELFSDRLAEDVLSDDQNTVDPVLGIRIRRKGKKEDGSGNRVSENERKTGRG